MTLYGSLALVCPLLMQSLNSPRSPCGQKLVSFICITVGRWWQLCNMSPTCSSGEHLQFPGQTVLGEPCVKRRREWGAGWKTPGLPFQPVTSVTVWDTANLVNWFCLRISSPSKTKADRVNSTRHLISRPGWNIQLSGGKPSRVVSVLVLMFKKVKWAS